MFKLFILIIAIWVLVLNHKNSDTKNEKEVFEREFNDYTTKIKPSDRVVDPLYTQSDIANKNKGEVKEKKHSNQIKKEKSKDKRSEKKCSKNKLNEKNKKTPKFKKSENSNSVKSKETDEMLFQSDKGETLIIPRSLDDSFESFVENQKAMEKMRPKNHEQNANIWYGKNLDFINACIAEAYSRNRYALISGELLPEKESWSYIANKIVNNSMGEIKVSVNQDGLLINVEV